MDKTAERDFQSNIDFVNKAYEEVSTIGIGEKV